MKRFADWVLRHPEKAGVFAAISLTMALLIDLNALPWFDCAAFWLLSLVIMVLTIRKDLPCVLLAAALLAGSVRAGEKPQPAAGYIGVGVVVVCVGGYCVYKVVKFCQRKFPKDKATNTNELYSVFGGGVENDEEYGASWNYGALGSCLQPTGRSSAYSGAEPEPSSPTTFILSIRIKSQENLVTSMRAAADEFQDWNGFQTDMAAHGLTVTGIPDNSQFFSRNRHPVSAGEVPISFGPEPGAVTISSGTMVRVAIERSIDLTAWEPLLSVNQPAGTAFRVLDTSMEASCFYRAKILP